MTEFGEEPTDSDDEGPSELEKELAKDVDRPAPLFARKEAPAADDSVDPILGSSTAHDGAQEEDNVDQSIATIQGEDAPAVSNGERMQYDTEADGSPVVGDLLKIRFVDYHVVPTILVSHLSLLLGGCRFGAKACLHAGLAGFLLPLPVE